MLVLNKTDGRECPLMTVIERLNKFSDGVKFNVKTLNIRPTLRAVRLETRRAGDSCSPQEPKSGRAARPAQ